MRIIPMKSKIVTADDQVRPLFAVVDQAGRTIIQTPFKDRAETILLLLA